MLVVSANWGVTDGSLGGDGVETAAAWCRDVFRAALRTGFRHDGRYRPIDGIDIVLAGDTCDSLTSATWTTAARPWHGGRRATDLHRRVAGAAVRRARPLLAGLARWARRGVAVPEADRRGRPILASRVRVPVRIVLLTGDRDPWLEEATEAAARFGCRVGRWWSEAAVEIGHGAERDPLWSTEERPAATGRAPTIGETLGVDRGVGVAMRLTALGCSPSRIAALVSPLAAVGPLEMPRVLLEWLAGMGDGISRRRILDAWRHAVSAWRQAAERQRPVSALDGCPLDALASVLMAEESAEAFERAVATGLWARLEPIFPGAAADAAHSDRVVVLGHHPALADPEGGVAASPIIGLGNTVRPGRPARLATGHRPGIAGAGAAPIRGPRTIVGRRGPDDRVQWEALSTGELGPPTLGWMVRRPRHVDAA